MSRQLERRIRKSPSPSIFSISPFAMLRKISDTEVISFWSKAADVEVIKPDA